MGTAISVSTTEQSHLYENDSADSSNPNAG